MPRDGGFSVCDLRASRGDVCLLRRNSRIPSEEGAFIRAKAHGSAEAVASVIECAEVFLICRIRDPVATGRGSTAAGSPRGRIEGVHDEQVAAAYDARAAEYVALIGRIDQMERQDVALIGRWRDETPGPLLDAGCGPGLWTAFLGEGGRDVIGVDIAAEFLGTAREHHPGVRFEAASMRDLPFPDGSFDGILAWYSLIHIRPEELRSVLDELARVTAPGGWILIGFFDGEPGEQFAHAIAPAHYWSAEALGALLDDAGFTVLEAERREREPGAVGSVRPHGALIASRR